MYAVIKSGGKQYRVKEGDVLKLEKLPTEVGNVVEFNEVLMVADGDDVIVGAPTVEKAVVKAEVMAQARHSKVKIIKFRRRKHHRKQMGHRQYYTQVKVTAIEK
jgi:large subunit ribosomal protein L21